MLGRDDRELWPALSAASGRDDPVGIWRGEVEMDPDGLAGDLLREGVVYVVKGRAKEVAGIRESAKRRSDVQRHCRFTPPQTG